MAQLDTGQNFVSGVGGVAVFSLWSPGQSDKESPRSLINARIFARFRSGYADEIIAATSIIESAPLLTRDARILRSKLVPLV